MFAKALEIPDHSLIEFDWKTKHGRLKQTPRFVYNFRIADWKGLREDLVKIPWDTIYLMSSVDNVWEAWKTLYFQAVEGNIQKKLIKRRRDVLGLTRPLSMLGRYSTLLGLMYRRYLPP